MKKTILIIILLSLGACQTPITQERVRRIDTNVRTRLQNKSFAFEDSGKVHILSRDTINILPFESEIEQGLPFFVWNGTRIDTVFDTIKIKYNQPNNSFNVEYLSKTDTLRDTVFIYKTPDNTNDWEKYKLWILIFLLALTPFAFMIMRRK